MDEVTGTFTDKSDLRSSTQWYTLHFSDQKLALHFQEVTFDNALEFNERLLHRSVLNGSAELSNTTYLSMPTDDLIKSASDFDKAAWTSLDKEFRENCDSGSLFFKRENFKAPGHNHWAKLGAAQLAFDPEGLQLTWTYDELKVKALLPSSELEGCLQYMRADSANTLLMSMSNEQDDRWNDLCRYFEKFGVIVSL